MSGGDESDAVAAEEGRLVTLDVAADGEVLLVVIKDQLWSAIKPLLDATDPGS